MARRKQPADEIVSGAERASDAALADLSGPAGDAAGELNVLVFRLGDHSFGLRLHDVSEILRPPPLVQMPLGPKSLLGLGNLRGVVMAVVGLRRLLGFADAVASEANRIIVIDRGAPVGLLVDRIERLAVVPAGQVDHDVAGAGAVDPDLLHGVIKTAGDSIKILDPERLFRDEFARLGRAGPRAQSRISLGSGAGKQAAERPGLVALLSFDLGAQEYALPLDRVVEVIALPDHVSELPRPETAVLGVMTLRDRLLPLVSLRALLGLPEDTGRKERGKVLVLSIGNGAIGLVADRSRHILRVDPGLIDPAPALLTRGAGDAEIASICRLEHGERLVAVLSPDRLFRSELLKRLFAEQNEAGAMAQDGGASMSDEDFVIFRLGEQDYGLPIAAVDEVARPPERITVLPKAPAFIDGVINLRGSVVPVVDLRRRFQVSSSTEPKPGQRILVLALGGGKTGFMVDSVSEILKVSADAISAAPEVSSQARLIDRVANLDEQGRIILLIDPGQLLDRVEADVLAGFDPAQSDPALRAS
jgi:purine-binding chemotaxis protein CheW